jgi:F420-dependent oxidoreductase-like protein
MKLGLQIPSFTWPGGAEAIRVKLADIARGAEEAGFDSLWVMDHFFQIRGVGPVEAEMLESYSTLGYLAGVTNRMQLGALVTGVIYRHPGVLVKTVTTLDVLSGGRAYFGLGAGWFEREALGLGVPFPPLKERFKRLEETLQIARQMWSEDDGPFTGTHFQLAETLCRPQPITQPHPPILIGGMGEHKTLRLVAEYADACNLFSRTGVETLRAKLDALKRHCERLQRDYAVIEKTTLSTVTLAAGASDAKDVIDQCSGLAAIGIQHCIFNMPNVHEMEPLRIFGREIIPALREL